jgi:hypothetical protein
MSLRGEKRRRRKLISEAKKENGDEIATPSARNDRLKRACNDNKRDARNDKENRTTVLV